MGNKRINIAYYTADWNRELVSVALHTVKKYLEQHPDVSVQVFDCFSFALYSGRSESGYQIYDLPDMGRYDAVIVQAHQIMDTDAIRRLEERIIETGVPAMSIGATMKGCISIGTDDYSAAREMTEHLVKVHGCRSFLYRKGSERDDGRGEAELRRGAFEDVCRENGIPDARIAYYEGGWESRKGQAAVEELLAKGDPLPDAIVSANDEMALGAMGALADAGIEVPGDVIVTGFDGILSSSLSDPGLTTISRDFETLILKAMEIMVARARGANGTEQKRIFSPHRMVCSESCGCSEKVLSELSKIKRMYYANARQQEKYYFQQDTMTADLFRTDRERILDTVEQHHQIFGERMYVYINEDYYDHYWSDESEEEEELNGMPYSDTLVLCACSVPGVEREEETAYMRIRRPELTDAPLLREEQLTIFYALHFRKINIGFLVLTNPPTVEEMHLRESNVNLLVFAMENARQRIRSKRLNEKLNALYVQDSLTGLYNRYGYDRLAEGIFEEIDEQGRDIHVLFLDIDDMKGINDRFGHDRGDLAIRTVARVMKNSCRKTDFKMRYGGDEFVIVTEAGKVDLKGRLQENFRRVNEDGTLPFHLSVSIGDYTIHGDKPASLDDLLRHADRLMYEEKKRKKSGLTNRV